ncbi:MAG: 2-hydroxy-3-oxopropionate reductase [Planctomycetota bacterium]
MSHEETERRTIGIIGLGLMGTALTERFLEAGWLPRIWNRSPEKARPLTDKGAIWSDDPLAECSQIVISLYSGDVVDEVLRGFETSLRSAQMLIDTTTGDPEQAVARGERLRQVGVQYSDAPISGSSEQTRRGEAVVMVGCDPALWAACADIWPILGQRAFHTGGCGTASRMKLVTNLVLGLNRAALAEGLAFAESLGINPAAALEVLRGSPAYSRQMDTKGSRMVDRNFSVQARLSQHLKDVHLMLQAAAAARQALPLSETHCQLLERAERLGFGEHDNSAVFMAIVGSQPDAAQGNSLGVPSKVVNDTPSS